MYVHHNLLYRMSAEKKIDCYVEFYKVLDPSERKKENLQKVVDSYCYITGTYTVDKLHYGQVMTFKGTYNFYRSHAV